MLKSALLEQSAVLRPGPLFRNGLVIVVLLLVPLWFTATALAQNAGPQRAIEQLEKCSKEERRQGCVNILTSRDAGKGRLAVKAQVRGGRIIWYEYDRESGRVRRTN